jgi:serine/threonine-protein kinase HipA
MVTNTTQPKIIKVFADWDGLGGPIYMGTLLVESLRGKENFSFTYDTIWLGHPSAMAIDPALGLYTGPQYPTADKAMFGVFTDSSPDRWGRVLMNRREAIRAFQEERKPKTLMESDYLLGVSDTFRIGALRFAISIDGPFMDDDKGLPAPPFTSLRSLEEASLHIERNDLKSKSEEARWLNMLLAPGGSLGGARPKASVIDPEKNLWIAKFPSMNDTWDVGAWEAIANELSKKCGLSTAEGQARRFAQPHHTYLSRRFDRIGSQRIHFASAMTMLSQADGESAASGVSYLHLAEFIQRNGAKPDQDLKELWSRIAFNIHISNTDDHLRNHGFLLTPKGWTLAPAYDVNPNPWGTGLHLNIDENNNSLDPELIMSVYPSFRLNKKEAEETLALIRKQTKTWNQEARKFGIKSNEMNMMEAAFTKAT